FSVPPLPVEDTHRLTGFSYFLIFSAKRSFPDFESVLIGGFCLGMIFIRGIETCDQVKLSRIFAGLAPGGLLEELQRPLARANSLGSLVRIAKLLRFSG